MKEKIVIFDVDNTLIKGDSLLIAACCSVNKYQFFVRLIYFLPFIFFAKIGLKNTKKLKEDFLSIFSICEMFNSNSEGKYLNLIKLKLREKAITKLNFHKSKGHKIFLCSASPNMLIQSLAKELDVKLISTKLKKFDNQWVPKIDGMNCSGKEKLNQIVNNISNLRDFKLEVYGDSYGDKEILEKADHPHYRDFSSRIIPYPLFSGKKFLILFSILIPIYFLIIKLNLNNEIYIILNQIKGTIYLGLSIILLSYFIRFLRWNLLLNSLGLKPPLLINFKIWMGSYAFTMTPGKAGEMIRCLLLKKKLKLNPILTFPAFIFERFSDFLSVLLIILLNLKSISKLDLFKEIYFDRFYVLYIAITISVLIILIKIFISKNSFYFKNKLLKIKNFKKNFLNILKRLFNPKILIISTLLGTLSWSLEGISFFLILKSLNAQISLGITIFTHTTAGLIGSLTFIPGGIGTTEVSTIGILSMNNIPLYISTSATMLIRIMTLWFATLLGIFCLLILKKD